jgi:protein TonB
MTRPETLFEFMPYGAPELLEASRPGLARALALGSLAWLALFALFLTSGPWSPRTVAIEIAHVAPAHDMITPPSIDPPAPAHRPVIPAAAPEHGTVVPVDLPLPEVPVLPPVDPAFGSETGTGREVGETPLGNDGGAAREGTSIQIDAPVKEYEIDRPLALIVGPKPLYPDFAREAGVEGDVRLRLLVGMDGRVEQVTVVRGVPMLDEAAVTGVRPWVFTAPTVEGRPVRVWVEVPVRFRLHAN